jgi:hypothetical protein
VFRVDQRGTRGGGGVVDRALGDPLADPLDLKVAERVALARHLGLAVVDLDQFDEEALLRLAGDDARLLAVALLHQVGEDGHVVAAHALGRLVAALAVLLQDRPDVLEVTDLRGRVFLRLLGGERSGEQGQQRQRERTGHER